MRIVKERFPGLSPPISVRARVYMNKPKRSIEYALGTEKEALLGGNAGHGESQRFSNTSQYRNVGLNELVA